MYGVYVHFNMYVRIKCYFTPPGRICMYVCMYERINIHNCYQWMNMCDVLIQVQYMSRMDDIRVMRVKLKELVREHAISKVRVIRNI